MRNEVCSSLTKFYSNTPSPPALTPNKRGKKKFQSPLNPLLFPLVPESSLLSTKFVNKCRIRAHLIRVLESVYISVFAFMLVMAGGLATASNSNVQYNGKIACHVVVSCILAALGEALFGYDIGVSGISLSLFLQVACLRIVNFLFQLFWY